MTSLDDDLNTCTNCHRYGHNLVQLLEAAERRHRLATRALHDWAEHQNTDRAEVAYIVALHARIAQLEQNLERITQRGKQRTAA